MAVNHLKSKGSPCDDVGNPGDATYGVDPYPVGADIEDPNLQGNCNLTRTAAAQVLGGWMATDPTGTGAERTMILGDLNAYANEDPIVALEALGYTDVHEQFAGGNAWAVGGHTYVFDGELGSLDYAMADATLLPFVTGAAAWAINADEPFAIDYENFNPPGQAQPDQWKSSDHDPVVVGIEFGPMCQGLPATIVGTPGRDLLLGTNGDDVIVADAGNDLVLGFGGDDVICAGAGNDLVLAGRGDDVIDGGPGRDLGNGGRGTDTCIAVEWASSCRSA